MIKYSLIEHIHLSELDIESEEYSLEYYYSAQENNAPDAVKESIKKYGLLYPPVLVYGSDRYRVVTGKRYIDIYRKLKRDIPSALLIENPEGKYSRYEFLKFLIHLKKAIAGFNVVEKSIAYKKLFDLNGNVDNDILCILKIPRNEEIIQNYLKLACAPEKIKTLILRGRLNELTAFEIFNCAEKDWELLALFIADVFLGTKKRNKLISMIHDISQRDGTDIENLIENNEIKNILDLRIDLPHIGEKIFNHFERQRYPFIYQYREQFYNKLKEVGFENSSRFIVPKDFEDWEFKLVFPFSSVKDFIKKVDKLKKVGESRPFDELMKLRK